MILISQTPLQHQDVSNKLLEMQHSVLQASYHLSIPPYQGIMHDPAHMVCMHSFELHVLH